MGIKVTGNSRIDTATAEIAVLIRDARVGLPRYREQDHYDEAMRLRDEIMEGAAEHGANLALDQRVAHHLKVIHGYVTLDEIHPVSGKALALIQGQCGCSVECIMQPPPVLPPWRPANNGTSKRMWFLIRGYGTESDSVPLADRYHYGPTGHVARYGSVETAQAAADKLNGGTR